MSTSTTANSKAILLFRNDLRIHDNYIISRAKELVVSKQVDEVIPLYCFDPRFYQKNIIQYQPLRMEAPEPKMGIYRAQFLLESVLDLKKQLQNIQSDLLVKIGLPEQVLQDIQKEFSNSKLVVITQQEVTSEELTIDKQIQDSLQNNGKFEQLWGATLYHHDDIPFQKPSFQDLDNTFTLFKNRVENKVKIRPLANSAQTGQLPLPKSSQQLMQQFSFEPKWEDLPLDEKVKSNGPPKLDERSALDFKGGESEALKRLHYFIWDKQLIKDYFNIRNGMVGGDYSTKLSPWLAHGCISPRKIYYEIQEYQKQQVSNKSTYWVIFELTWRDFFRFLFLKHGDSIFYEYGPGGRNIEWSKDQNVHMQKWKNGQTGRPLVDANMNELKNSGFMSNRGRQNVASYLILNLGVDWRYGASYFEHYLLDYDVCSNWGNWCQAAGLLGGRLNKFNITKQSHDYDYNGQYVKHWIPQLKSLPVTFVHEPWSMSQQQQLNYNCIINQDYPYKIDKDSGGPGARGGRGGGRDGGRRGVRGGRGYQGGGGGKTYKNDQY